MAIIISDVKLSPQTTNTLQKTKISVFVKESVKEPIAYRLPFKIGRIKGGIK